MWLVLVHVGVVVVVGMVKLMRFASPSPFVCACVRICDMARVRAAGRKSGRGWYIVAYFGARRGYGWYVEAYVTLFTFTVWVCLCLHI